MENSVTPITPELVIETSTVADAVDDFLDRPISASEAEKLLDHDIPEGVLAQITMSTPRRQVIAMLTVWDAMNSRAGRKMLFDRVFPKVQRLEVSGADGGAIAIQQTIGAMDEGTIAAVRDIGSKLARLQSGGEE